jgi:hypothetical protein
MIDDDECGAVGGMRISRGNQNTREKPASAPLCPPQIPHNLTWTQTRATAVGNRPTNRLSYVTAVTINVKENYVGLLNKV